MPDGAKNTMENNPTETTGEVPVAVESQTAETTAPETPTGTPSESPESSSQGEDLTALIEAEKSRKPDPNKAKERFEKKRKPEDDGDETPVDDDDRPLTKREVEQMIAERTHQVTIETLSDKLVEISEELTGTPQEAELVRAIHANRIFPAGMSLREQMQEAYAIANAKRIEARNAELVRTVRSQQTASRNTATTHRDPQAALEPEMAPDLKASMLRAGYTFNGTTRRYEKKLPNGKTLVKVPGQPPTIAS